MAAAATWRGGQPGLRHWGWHPLPNGGRRPQAYDDDDDVKVERDDKSGLASSGEIAREQRDDKSLSDC